MSRDLTIIKAVGRMDADDFRQWTADYYAGTVTSLHLWDVTKADLSSLTREDIIEDARSTHQVSARRKGGKTAFVTQRDVDFGISRICGAYSQIEIGLIEYQAFRTLEDAEEWLGVGDRPA